MNNVKIILPILIVLFLAPNAAKADQLTKVKYDNVNKVVKVCGQTAVGHNSLAAAAGYGSDLNASSCGTAIVQCTPFTQNVYCAEPYAKIVKKTKTWNCQNNAFDKSKTIYACPQPPICSPSTTEIASGGYGMSHHQAYGCGSKDLNSGIEDAKYILKWGISEYTSSPTVAVALLNNLNVRFFNRADQTVAQACAGSYEQHYTDTLPTGQTVTYDNWASIRMHQLEDEYDTEVKVSNSPSICDSCVKIATGTSTTSLADAVTQTVANMASWNNQEAKTAAKKALKSATTTDVNDPNYIKAIPQDCYYKTGICGPNYQPDINNMPTHSVVTATTDDFLIVSQKDTKPGSLATFKLTISKNICP